MVVLLVTFVGAMLIVMASIIYAQIRTYRLLQAVKDIDPPLHHCLVFVGPIRTSGNPVAIIEYLFSGDVHPDARIQRERERARKAHLVVAGTALIWFLIVVVGLLLVAAIGSSIRASR